MADMPEDNGGGGEDTGRTQWLLKGILITTRETATECANRRGEKIGRWVERAVLRQIETERGDQLFSPALLAAPAAPAAELPPVLPEPIDAQRAKLALAALDTLGKAAGSGLQVPESVQKHVWALLGGALRQARGLKPRAAPVRDQTENGRVARLGRESA